MASVVSGLSKPIDDTGDGKVVNRFLDGLEAAVPQEAATANAAVDQVDTLPEDVTFDGGNFTITITLNSGEAFTTASILFSANAATIEGAIDTAATSASVVGWTNGDISVSGGSLATADIILTYDGASVAGLNHSVAVATDVDLTTGTLDVFSTTTIGHPVAGALQLLGTQGWINVVTLDDPSTWTRNRNVGIPEGGVVEYFARQAEAELQNPAAYAKVIDLSLQTKPTQPVSPITQGL